VGEEEEFQRTILTSNRKRRPIGGHLPFEKSRSYLGTFALIAALGLGGLTAYWYCSQINTIQQATGRSGAGNIWKSHDDAQRKSYQERQKKALARLKAHQQQGKPE
jgi:hypothetical protein